MDTSIDLIKRKTFIRKIEKEHRAEFQKELQKRNKLAIENDKKILKKLEQNLVISEQKIKQKSDLFEKEILNQINTDECITLTSCAEYEEKLKQAFQLKLRKLAQIKDELKIREENQRQQNSLFEKYKIIYIASIANFTKIFQRLSAESQQKMGTYKKTIQDLITEFDEIQGAGKFGTVELEAIDNICKRLDKVIQVLQEEENRANEEVKKQAELQEAQRQQAQNEEAAQDTVDSLQKAYEKYGTPENIKRFEIFCNFYKEQYNALRTLIEDPNMEKIRFRYKKAINIPVNAINSINAAHFIDKYDRLFALLSGNPVQVDNVQIAANDPAINAFCKIQLARKFVSQGDHVVSSHLQSAFPIAAIIVALWQKFPDFGQLLLARFYEECPFLVPINLIRLEGQSEVEYQEALGHRYENGVMELDTNYLKRLKGICRLFFAIMITRSRNGISDPNPFSIENGWTWFCNILNLKPIHDTKVYCTIIDEFLQTTGFMMRRCYGKQFLKLIIFIKKEYLILMETECGPKNRLEGIIDDILKCGTIKEPEGLLPPNFW